MRLAVVAVGMLAAFCASIGTTSRALADCLFNDEGQMTMCFDSFCRLEVNLVRHDAALCRGGPNEMTDAIMERTDLTPEGAAVMAAATCEYLELFMSEAKYFGDDDAYDSVEDLESKRCRELEKFKARWADRFENKRQQNEEAAALADARSDSPDRD